MVYFLDGAFNSLTWLEIIPSNAAMMDLTLMTHQFIKQKNKFFCKTLMFVIIRYELGNNFHTPKAIC